MNQPQWNLFKRRVEEASNIRRTILELYPGQTLRLAVLLGIRDRVLGDKERDLLREFYATELDWR